MKETRIAKVNINKKGGTASKNAVGYKITIPNAWIGEMGISENDRDVRLVFDGKIITIEKEDTIMFKMDKRKKVEVLDVNKEYKNANDALIDLGYDNIGDCDIQYKGEEIRKNIYKKDEKYYHYVGMEYNNTYIYNISIRELIEA